VQLRPRPPVITSAPLSALICRQKTAMSIRAVQILSGLQCALLVAAIALGGCGGRIALKHQRELDRLLAARGIEASEIVLPDRLTDAARSWLYRTEPPRPDSSGRFFDLVEALENRVDVEMVYEPGYTGTAGEVFETGVYNCLSYSHLLLALAREMGVDASYYQVERSRRYRREGDVVLVSGHVTVGFGRWPDQKLVKFTARTDADYRSARPISDLTALGLYYSNRGSELIASGELDKALEWLELATRLTPHLPGNWVNLGVVKRRLGDLDGAEAAYLRAIEVGERFYPAFRNLAALYQVRGESEMRTRMMNLLGGRGNRNPYTWLALGDHSLEEHRWDEAREFYRRALRLATDPAEPMAALGLLALREGDRGVASEWLERAKETDSNAIERLEELETALYPERARQAGREILIE
jgi:tetratricopeptide (TPR) repeat protein